MRGHVEAIHHVPVEGELEARFHGLGRLAVAGEELVGARLRVCLQVHQVSVVGAIIVVLVEVQVVVLVLLLHVPLVLGLLRFCRLLRFRRPAERDGEEGEEEEDTCRGRWYHSHFGRYSSKYVCYDIIVHYFKSIIRRHERNISFTLFSPHPLFVFRYNLF